jgi:hypothetical protein
MSRKPGNAWTVEELEKFVVRNSEAAEKYQPGPKRQKLLQEANRYRSLLETKMDFDALAARPVELP